MLAASFRSSDELMKVASIHLFKQRLYLILRRAISKGDKTRTKPASLRSQSDGNLVAGFSHARGHDYPCVIPPHDMAYDIALSSAEILHSQNERES